MLRSSQVSLLGIQSTVTIEKNGRLVTVGVFQADPSSAPIRFNFLQARRRAHVLKVFARSVGKHSASVRNQARQDALGEVMLPG